MELPSSSSRPLPLELNCEIFKCLKLPIQKKFIWGLGRDIYEIFGHKVFIKIAMPIRNKLAKHLQVSISTCGSDGADLPEFINFFKEDPWEKDLPEYAKKIGFGDGPDSVLAMLKTFPEDITVQEELGQIKLKPVPNEQTKENLALIDKSNEEKAKYERDPANYIEGILNLEDY